MVKKKEPPVVWVCKKCGRFFHNPVKEDKFTTGMVCSHCGSRMVRDEIA